MSKTSKFALILGLASATAGLPALWAQSNSDAAGVAAAIRFQKAEDAAAARQARIEAGRAPAQSKANNTPTQAVEKPSQENGVAAAIRFQKAEDEAAARQARIEASRENEANSADRMAPRTASVRKATPQPKHNPQ